MRMSSNRSQPLQTNHRLNLNPKAMTSFSKTRVTTTELYYIYIWRSDSYTFASQRPVEKNMAADELSMT